MHFRSHGCWRYSLLRSDLLQKSQIRCFDLSGFGASYSSLFPDVISLPQFPFFIVFSAKCHITFIGTQHDLCAFPHDFSAGISCIALCTFPAPSEYWQISSFPSPRIWNIVLPFFCFSFIDHTALCHLLLYLQSGLWSGLHLFLHRYGCFPAQSYQCIIIHIYTVMVHTYLVILRKKRCQLYFRKKDQITVFCHITVFQAFIKVLRYFFSHTHLYKCNFHLPFPFTSFIFSRSLL